MSDDILDNVILIIVTMIIGVVLLILGIAFQSFIMALVGGFFVGGVPIIKLIQLILDR